MSPLFLYFDTDMMCVDYQPHSAHLTSSPVHEKHFSSNHQTLAPAHKCRCCHTLSATCFRILRIIVSL